MSTNKLIVITGQTATGKTTLAAHIAKLLDGEIISADSRQVYKFMDIGTGKDLDDFTIDDKKIPYHLINICEPGEEYNIYRYQKDFLEVYKDIISRNKQPILCGGSGLYVESVLKNYKLMNVPINEQLRNNLEEKTDEELAIVLQSYTTPHNTTDLMYRKRLIRAIEIADYQSKSNIDEQLPELDHIIFGIRFERDMLKKRITERLRARFDEGMIDEAKNLLDMGISKDKLIYYGLEYKFLAEYLDGQYNYNDMYQKLNSAIHRFSKRQMTWFRRMEKNGFDINWIEGKLSLEDKIKFGMNLLK
ncbi:MAG: tRNA (adenosine(37)-N6)-dimethylallyltransferase MiaA [Candidatus Delongbacteria bacterium]|nr:tRNA (adenosine(37)-N6)-dimethylallyltransferase MiaA [Candidatus Delongbacteria bacterium]